MNQLNKCYQALYARIKYEFKWHLSLKIIFLNNLLEGEMENPLKTDYLFKKLSVFLFVLFSFFYVLKILTSFSLLNGEHYYYITKRNKIYKTMKFETRVCNHHSIM